jgi:hypothetical protein
VRVASKHGHEVVFVVEKIRNPALGKMTRKRHVMLMGLIVHGSFIFILRLALVVPAASTIPS